MKLIELAERCEAAEGPDRHIDLLIARAIGLVSPDANFDQREGRDVAWGRNRLGVAVPYYTASLDAAMSLVPEGYRLGTLLEFDEPANHVRWAAKLFYRGKSGGMPSCGGTTPALALTAACLRARSASLTERIRGGGDEPDQGLGHVA